MGRIPAVVLAVLLVVSSVAFGGAGTVLAQDDGAEASVGWQGPHDRETAVGDPIRTPWEIGMANTDTATVVLTGARNYTESDYWANVTVRDDDGDGTVSLHLNTWKIGHSNPWRAESGTVVSADADPVPDGKLVNKTKGWSSASYALLLAAGDDPTVAQDSTEIARLRLEEGETETPYGITAPAGTMPETLGQVFNGTGLTANRRAFAPTWANMSSREDSTVAVGDTYMFMPWGGGFYGAARHAIETSEDREAALQWLLEQGYLEFGMEQRGGEKVLDVDRAIEIGALSYDARAGFYHSMVALDTGAAVFDDGSGEHVRASPGDRFHVTVAKAGRVDADDDPSFLRTRGLNVSVVARSGTVQSPTRSLSNGEIGGTTTLSPGTTLDVYVDDGSTVHSYETAVIKLTDAGTDTRDHPWNVSIDWADDADSSSVRVTAWDGASLLGAEPPNAALGADQQGTTANPGDDDGDDGDGDPDGTTDDGATASTTDVDESNGGATITTATTAGGDDGDGGGGGTIPGLTAVTALLALVTAALLVRRR